MRLSFKHCIHLAVYLTVLSIFDTIEGVRFFNDSKATNSLATEMALGGFQKDQLIFVGWRIGWRQLPL